MYNMFKTLASHWRVELSRVLPRRVNCLERYQQWKTVNNFIGCCCSKHFISIWSVFLKQIKIHIGFIDFGNKWLYVEPKSFSSLLCCFIQKYEPVFELLTFFWGYDKCSIWIPSRELLIIKVPMKYGTLSLNEGKAYN